MDLVQRVQAIILKPKDEWVKIKGESTPVAGLFTSYAVVLAAIPPAAQLLGRLLFPEHIPFRSVVLWGVGRALEYAIVSYIFALVSTYVFGFIINALAPNFSSPQNLPNAMKLAVYSMTPAWIAGILNIIPGLSILVTLASLYGLYILYMGFDSPMMETPKDKVLGYLVVSIVVVIALLLVSGLVVGGIAFRTI